MRNAVWKNVNLLMLINPYIFTKCIHFFLNPILFICIYMIRSKLIMHLKSFLPFLDDFSITLNLNNSETNNCHHLTVEETLLYVIAL